MSRILVSNNADKIRLIAANIFFIAVFILRLSISNLFSVPATYEKIQELEKMEKAPQPARITRSNVVYEAGNLRDPFQAPAEEEIVSSQNIPGTPSKQGANKLTEIHPPSLAIQGLVWGGSFPQAIINNKVVKTGDKIGDCIIVGIDKDGVIVSSGGKEFKLPSPASGIKSTKAP